MSSSAITYLIMGLVTGGFYALATLGFSIGWATVRMPDIGYIAFIYIAGELVAILCKMLNIEPLVLFPLILISFFGIGVLTVSYTHLTLPTSDLV